MLDIPNTRLDKAGAYKMARHNQSRKEDPTYAQRWRISNALAKHKSGSDRPKVTLPRVMFLERPEID